MERVEREWRQQQKQRQGDMKKHACSRNGWSFGVAEAHGFWDRHGAGA